uniref:Uncharacterized protein n=1 Tax=Romanomermis culicivorax TaxID=13658 RepID=A0A915KHJ3_ROMCU
MGFIKTLQFSPMIYRRLLSILSVQAMENNTQCTTTTEQYVVGTIYILISCFYSIPYLFCLIIIKMDKRLSKEQYYKIVYHMGVADLTQLVFNGISGGIFTYWCIDHRESTVYFWINKAIGGLMNFCWVIYCSFAHLLAFNRFCHVLYKHYVGVIFSPKNTSIMMGGVWLYGLVWQAAYLVPGINLFYHIDDYNWSYDSMDLSQRAWMAELISDTFHTGGMIVWYTIVLGKLYFHAGNLQSDGFNRQDKKERLVLIQAILLCLMVILTLIGFFIVPRFWDNRWMNVLSNVIWLSCAGNNAIIYILFNSTVKQKMKKLLKNPCTTGIVLVTPLVNTNTKNLKL